MFKLCLPFCPDFIVKAIFGCCLNLQDVKYVVSSAPRRADERLLLTTLRFSLMRVHSFVQLVATIWLIKPHLVKPYVIVCMLILS